MEKKSQCIHAEQSCFSGLGELSSKANLNGVSKGLTSLVTEDVRTRFLMKTRSKKKTERLTHSSFVFFFSSRPIVKNVKFQDAIFGCVYIQSAILFSVVRLTRTTAVTTFKCVIFYIFVLMCLGLSIIYHITGLQ
jgi:hypothetical protein